jgi:ADP-ribose pyrophosphatase YjhB (NUDIX family)
MAANRSAPDSAFAVLTRAGRVLLVRTHGGKWQLPGGRLERREKHWDAVRREVREETGIRAEILGLTGVYGRKDGSRAVVFAARASNGGKLAGPRNEIREQRWVSVRLARQLLKGKTFRRLRDALASPEAFARKRKRVSRWRTALG